MKGNAIVTRNTVEKMKLAGLLMLRQMHAEQLKAQNTLFSNRPSIKTKEDVLFMYLITLLLCCIEKVVKLSVKVVLKIFGLNR